MNAHLEYLLRLGDNCLVLAQRLCEWCGHGPALEEDIALTNIALDLLGQGRMWLSYAAEFEGKGRDEDSLAFLREGREYRNVLLVELPKGNYADTVTRQFLFDAWHSHLVAGLTRSCDPRIVAIAQKATKEVRYHLERSAGLVVALGDGTDTSHHLMQAAIDRLWPYTGELFDVDEVDETCSADGLAPAADSFEVPWRAEIERVFRRATLRMPQQPGYQRGGKRGVHTEHLGHLLAELQHMQRAYPGAQW